MRKPIEVLHHPSDDLSRSLIAFEQISTLVIVVELVSPAPEALVAFAKSADDLVGQRELLNVHGPISW